MIFKLFSELGSYIELDIGTADRLVHYDSLFP